jgi:hypothetical protein
MIWKQVLVFKKLFNTYQNKQTLVYTALTWKKLKN